MRNLLLTLLVCIPVEHHIHGSDDVLWLYAHAVHRSTSLSDD